MLAQGEKTSTPPGHCPLTGTQAQAQGDQSLALGLAPPHSSLELASPLGRLVASA